MRLTRGMVALALVAGAVCLSNAGRLADGPVIDAHAAAAAQDPPKPQPQQTPDEFVPIDQLPPEEQLPAAPMVVAAYVFVWVAFLGYVFLLVKRVQKVEGDLQKLERGQK